MNFHRGPRYQQGRGIGSLFSGLLRGFAPIARMGLNAGKKFLQSDMVKNIGNTVLDTGKKMALNMAADLLEGKNVKEGAQQEIEETKRKIASTLRGSGKKRKNNFSSSRKLKRLRQDKEYNLLF